MAIRQIRIEGDPLLRKVSRPVKEVNARIKALLDDMLETMYDDNGVGLAAPQVGILRRLIVLDAGKGPFKMVNPKIIKESEETQIDVEGCLSVPNLNGTVIRPQTICVRYLDENGESKMVEASGLFARVILHEVDHLDGILFRDRIDRIIDMENPTDEMIEYLAKNNLLDDTDEPDSDGPLEDGAEQAETIEEETEVKEL